MIFTGSIIRSTDFKKVKLTRELVMVLLVRFVLTPVFMILLLRLLPIPVLMKQVFFLLATMPAMTQLGIMAKVSNSDYEFASILVTVTTTVSMMVLPLYTIILVQWNVFG
jgi:predicted permease